MLLQLMRFSLILLVVGGFNTILAQPQISLDIQMIVGTGELFRGHTWEDTRESIKKREHATLTLANDSILQYEFSLDDQRSIEMVYTFDISGVLRRIETATIFDNGHQELGFQESLVKFYRSKLGEPEQVKNGVWIWKHQQGYQIEVVSLRDQAGLGTEIIFTRI